MILADSSIWIAILRGDETPLTGHFMTAARAGQMVVGDLILLEVLQGARNEAHARLLERMMRQYPIVPLLEGDLPVRAAANYRMLREHGVTAKRTVDLIIATFCIERDHILLHRDKDYSYFEKHLGLRTL